MLAISQKLLERLACESIECCSWKNNQSIDDALSGKGDVDLLVASHHQTRFAQILLILGFKEAKNIKIQYPRIHHFYGMDDATGKFLHLHVYYELVTGESHTKNYRIAVEKEVLQNAVQHSSGIKVPSPEWQLFLIMIRHYIKISCIPGFLLYSREKNDYDDEFTLCNESLCDGNFDIPKSNLIDNIFLNKLLDTYRDKSFYSQLWLGFQLRLKLRFSSRLSFLPHFFERYNQISHRLLNKLFYRKKKSIVNGGRLIAICGLDGTGKSTTVQELTKCLNSNFDVHTIHVGRPKATLLTTPLRLALWGRKILGKKNITTCTKDKSIEEYLQSEHKIGVIPALRYAGLAYERYSLLKKANRYRAKGYIVICDRYPSLNFGKMDSARIPVSDDSSFIIKQCAKIESRLYASMVPPDLLIKLKVPVEVAIDRNNKRIKEGKETDNELRARYLFNDCLQYNALSYKEIDTTIPLEESLFVIRNIVWKAL